MSSLCIAPATEAISEDKSVFLDINSAEATAEAAAEAAKTAYFGEGFFDDFPDCFEAHRPEDEFQNHMNHGRIAYAILVYYWITGDDFERLRGHSNEDDYYAYEEARERLFYKPEGMKFRVLYDALVLIKCFMDRPFVDVEPFRAHVHNVNLYVEMHPMDASDYNYLKQILELMNNEYHKDDEQVKDIFSNWEKKINNFLN